VCVHGDVIAKHVRAGGSGAHVRAGGEWALLDMTIACRCCKWEAAAAATKKRGVGIHFRGDGKVLPTHSPCTIGLPVNIIRGHGDLFLWDLQGSPHTCTSLFIGVPVAAKVHILLA